MRDLKRALVVAAVLAAVVLPARSVAAETRDPETAEAAVNVKLTVRLGKLVDGKRGEVKSYDLVLVSGGSGSRLLSGSRVPFPDTRGDDPDAGRVLYQNIGFTTEAHAWVLDDGRIKIAATIEDSRIVEVGGRNGPTVATRQLAVSAIVRSGAPLEVTRVDGIQDQSGFVEIEAQVLR